MESTEENLKMVAVLRQKLKVHILENHSLSYPMQKQLTEYSEDDQFLLRFIIGRKYDVEKAFQSILKYTELKICKYPEMFTDEISERVKTVLNDEIIGILKHRDSLKRGIGLLRLSKMDKMKVSLDDLVSAGRYLAEDLIRSQIFLENGGYIIIDCEQDPTKPGRFFTVSGIVRFVNVFWLSYPFQLKGLYFVNGPGPGVARFVFTLFKRLLPGKLKDRVHVMEGVEGLHEHLNKDYLPDCLGGPLSYEDAVLQFFPRPGLIVDHHEFISPS